MYTDIYCVHSVSSVAKKLVAIMMPENLFTKIHNQDTHDEYENGSGA